MKLTLEAQQKIIAHAIAHPDIEVCGAVIKGEVIEWENLAEDPTTTFLTPTFNPDKINAIYHSHIGEDETDFSVADIKACRASGIPYIVCHTPTQTIKTYDPNIAPPLLGRHWNWVYSNCYDLFRDYYQELGVELPEFYLESPRAWLKGSVGYLENLPLNGFVQLDRSALLQKHDVVLMFHRSGRFPNHVGIIVEPNQNAIIHHVEDALSERTVYDGMMMKFTHSIWRHRQFIQGLDTPRRERTGILGSTIELAEAGFRQLQ